MLRWIVPAVLLLSCATSVSACAPDDARASCRAIPVPQVQVVWLDPAGATVDRHLESDFRFIVEGGYLRIVPGSGVGQYLPALRWQTGQQQLGQRDLEQLVPAGSGSDTIWVFVLGDGLTSTAMWQADGHSASYHARSGDAPFAVITPGPDYARLQMFAHEVVEAASVGEINDACEGPVFTYYGDHILLPGYLVDGRCSFGLPSAPG